MLTLLIMTHTFTWARQKCLVEVLKWGERKKEEEALCAT
jgi:hypothetical protein